MESSVGVCRANREFYNQQSPFLPDQLPEQTEIQATVIIANIKRSAECSSQSVKNAGAVAGWGSHAASGQALSQVEQRLGTFPSVYSALSPGMAERLFIRFSGSMDGAQTKPSRQARLARRKLYFIYR